MRILTVRHPWAWAIIYGGKDVENRVRNLAGSFRGPIAIHVAQTIAKVTYGEYGLVKSAGWSPRSPLGLGHIIGVVDLVDVHHSNECWEATRRTTGPEEWVCSPWAEQDTHHLVLANPRPLVEPVPYKGALGLRELPADVVARVLEAVA